MVKFKALTLLNVYSIIFWMFVVAFWGFNSKWKNWSSVRPGNNMWKRDYWPENDSLRVKYESYVSIYQMRIYSYPILALYTYVFIS